jgi:site-specific DNA recombinase
MRCAIYTRYSSDLQRESSAEDQIRKCRSFAESKGWTVLDAFIRGDQEISGAALAGRSELLSLIAHSKTRSRPFDRILIDDTSRLARNVADALKLVDTLRFHGVGVTFVSQGIDTLDKSARQLVTFNGMMDEQFLVGLADKVHRGQEGRVLKGLNPGGKLYGYENVPILNPDRPGKYGRPAVDGVKQEIKSEQAEVVRRVFRMYADGMGLALVSKTLNAEGVPSPQPPRTRTLRAWCPSSIREILRNELYRGVRVWNRTVKVRNPETGRKVSKARPRDEWQRVEVPKLRIVPEDLWNAVHGRIGVINADSSAARLGGLNRTAASRSYLFSGLLVCGDCKSRLVIISGRGKRGYVKYGCPSHRYRGVCDNAVTIRQDRLEEQLLAALEQCLTNPEIIEYTLSRFQEELRKRLTDIERQATGLAEIRHERRQLQNQIERLTDAIVAAGHSPALLSKLGEAEAKIAELDRRIEECKPIDIATTVDEMRDFVSRNLINLKGLLNQNASKAKTAFARHIGQLILNPKQTPSGPVYEVTGGLNLLAGEDVMQVVARDGIEPPTPAFSGLRSTAAVARSLKSCAFLSLIGSPGRQLAVCNLLIPHPHQAFPKAKPAPPKTPENTVFAGAVFSVLRLEELGAVSNLKADLVSVYHAVNAKELFAIERIAPSQQGLLRAARLEAGLFASALDRAVDRESANAIRPMSNDLIADIDVLRAQNRDYALADGFRHMA